MRSCGLEPEPEPRLSETLDAQSRIESPLDYVINQIGSITERPGRLTIFFQQNLRDQKFPSQHLLSSHLRQTHPAIHSRTMISKCYLSATLFHAPRGVAPILVPNLAAIPDDWSAGDAEPIEKC